MVTVLASVGCHSLLTPPDAGHKAGPADLSVVITDAGAGDLATADASPGDMSCTPKVTSCLGLCGPISDPCLGRDVQCGGCPMSQVCNLETHVCEVPLKDCAALGAACGNTRNTCGTRLFCGDCVAGQECNNDTNQCVTCQYDLTTPSGIATACQKQGYECGPAWLGCGPESTISDCGTCPTGATPVCNPFFHICEPMCTPKTKAQACADALANHGIECGTIDDGCGSIIDCGSSACAAGTACGAQGDPGRCEPTEAPTECIGQGRNCGTITSDCGGTISCGTCTSPQVCNPNGICGMPCTPLTCGTIKNPPICGTVPDNCGGTVGPCGMCPTPTTNYTCVNNSCCLKRTCAGFYNGMCGTKLDDGCGQTIDCACGAGACSTATPGMTGTCCVNSAVCAAGSCNTTVTNTCTHVTTTCTCPVNANDWCDTTTTPGTCRDCTAFPGITHAPGVVGDVCSNGPAFDNDTVTCPCNGGLACSTSGTVVSGPTKGTCCQDMACDGTHCGPGFKNTCTGQTETCGCAAGFCNGSNMCQAFNQCSMFTNGNPGSTCGTFPKGNGTNMTCGCNSGECVVAGSPGHIAGPGEMGVCCNPTKASCGNQCNLPGPITTDSCLNTTQTCACDAQHFCTNMSCNALLVCANYQPTGGKTGDQCGTLSNGNGGTISCPCFTGAGYTNNTCDGTGHCSCTPNKTCTNCTDNGASDGCGGVKSCVCPDGGNTNYTVCDSAGTTIDAFDCCWPFSVSHLPPSFPAAGHGPNGEPLCTNGAVSNGCGGSFSINCPATNPNGDSPSDKTWPNVMCVAQPGGYGLCECTGDSCVQLGNGTHPNDGCGNFKSCGT